MTAVIAVGAVAATSTPALAGTTSRVSLSSTGLELDGWSSGPSLSADGRYVGFTSAAWNAVDRDSNDSSDVFVRDRRSSETVRVSVASSGAEGNGWSGGGALSTSGRYVVFESVATDLVADDTNDYADDGRDIFIRDRDADADGVFDEAGAVATRRVSLTRAGGEADRASESADIGNGRHVVFDSDATNLVPGDTNAANDVFVRDRMTSRTVRISVSTSGAQAAWAPGERPSDEGHPSISGSGRWVSFTSGATNLVADDTNRTLDVFARDRDTDADGVFDEGVAVKTVRVSVSSNGTQSSRVSFSSAISADGRHVAFTSESSSLTPGDTNGATDVFVRSLRTGRTIRVSLSTSGGQGAYSSALHESPSAISADGRYVTFTSLADNLVPGDTNGVADVFLRDRDTDADGDLDEPGAVRTTRASVASTGLQGDDHCWNGTAIAHSAPIVAFDCDATTLSDQADANGAPDVFLRTFP